MHGNTLILVKLVAYIAQLSKQSNDTLPVLVAIPSWATIWRHSISGILQPKAALLPLWMRALALMTHGPMLLIVVVVAVCSMVVVVVVAVVVGPNIWTTSRYATAYGRHMIPYLAPYLV